MDCMDSVSRNKVSMGFRLKIFPMYTVSRSPHAENIFASQRVH